MPRRACQHPENCRAVGRGGPCRLCDAAEIARRAVMMRERMAANRAEGRPVYASRPAEGQDQRMEDGGDP